jgi:hypothetical protein
MLNWGQIFEQLGVSGLIIGGITWLLKTLGQDFISRKFSAYEKELDIKSKEFQVILDADLQTHKAKLDKEHTKFQKLHEKRLEVIVELYKTIINLDVALQLLTAIVKPIPPNKTLKEMEQEQMEQAGDAYQEFQRFYLYNKIFFNPEICSILDKLKNTYWAGFWQGTTRQRLPPAPDFNIALMEAKKASETVTENIPPIKEKLEIEFRKLLGVI